MIVSTLIAIGAGLGVLSKAIELGQWIADRRRKKRARMDAETMRELGERTRELGEAMERLPRSSQRSRIR